MDDWHHQQHPLIPRDSNQDTNNNYALSGKVMLTSVITLFIVILLIICFHLYTRWFVRRLHRRHRRRLFHRAAAASRLSLSSSTARPLDPNLLSSLPTFVYTTNNEDSCRVSGRILECAVCLSEFEEGETGRVLPKCAHTFHVECIDTWFKSRSSCPLCRAPVRGPEPASLNRDELQVRVQNGTEPGPSTGSENLRMPAMEESRRKSLPEMVGIVVEMTGNRSEDRGVNGSNSRGNDGGLSLKRFVSI